METFYIGLATTFHDPAIAVVNSSGEVLFAEASERCLQNKRAICCAADIRETVRKVLTEYCDPQARFVIAKPWSKKLNGMMELMKAMGLANHEKLAKISGKMTRYLVQKDVMFAQIWQQYASFQLSGGHLADIIRCDFKNQNVSYARFSHHFAHAANACYTSPFSEAACMVVDGQGEWGSITYFDYKNSKLRQVHRVKGEESLGILYSICTIFCGFDPEKGEEWKVMGLAPYGKLDAEIYEWLRELVRVEGLDIKYCSMRGIEDWFTKMRTKARGKDVSALTVADLAWTIQHFYAEVMTELLANFHRMGLSDNLILGGGCALNSSFNGQIVGRTPFKNLHVPSAPADDGNAIGAAFLAFYQEHPERKHKPEILSPYLGSSFSKRSVENLARFGELQHMRHLPETIAQETAKLLAQGKLVGWAQGRAEFGPRALGNRSILADPRPSDMKDKINSLVKFREEFRPFAPSILDEFGEEYFENYQVTPYMDRTLAFKESVKQKVPAIVHINATGRLQSVRREWNARYYDLIRCFYEISGVPMLLNTSFNIMGKPIIHSLEDAVGLFYTTGLDALVIEDYLIEKKRN
jgi:carbamoyltransferase